jgi:hypothetical protein
MGDLQHRFDRSLEHGRPAVAALDLVYGRSMDP